ncbi:armadillo-type protein [Cladochytrium replicatum]|nr:armadillo-type protein [Cladochytrium replicatum]
MSGSTAQPVLTGQEPLPRILNDIRSRNDDVRRKAADELRDHAISISTEISTEGFSKFMNDVYRRIFELISSNDINDKIGGILAIDRLIDLEFEDGIKVTRFSNYLRTVLPGTDPQITVLASKALGRLALPGGTLVAEFVEFEMKRALEWLQGDRYESRRYAAVLVIRELAVNAPTLVYAYVPQILDLVLVGLKDPKVVIRDGAAEALNACLDLINQRESNQRNQWYRKIDEEAQKGFKSANVDVVHGSLLALKELMTHPDKYMESRFRDRCDTVMRYKESRDSLVRRTVIVMLPTLASFQPDAFVASYLDSSMAYLLVQLRKDRERGAAFISIGKIAIAVGSHIGPYLDAILQIIREGLTFKGRVKAPSEPPIFSCISMLAIAVGPALTKYMHELLDQIMSTGLTEPLYKALTDLAKNIPPLLPTIQDRLLNMLSMILSGHSYRHPGSPHRSMTTHSFSSQSGNITPMPEIRDTETIVLALKCLGGFNFQGHMLHELVRECAIGYLEDDNVEVRKAAALTCCQLLVRDPVCYQTSNNAMQIVGEVLEKLLGAGITDPDPSIRKEVLRSLDERFDHHLSQAENVRVLFIALNDEVFAIRELAIFIIGRLTNHNPAFVLPSLRKTMIQLLTELEYSGVSRQKEEAAVLLGHLIASSQVLVRPYVESILKVLLPKARDPSVGVAAKVLADLGELGRVGGEDVLPYLEKDLMPVIMDTLQDQSSSTKREAALKSLGQLASNTGWVIEPYVKYPNLLDLLISMLKTEQSTNLRKEVVKVMGILGALDPYKHKINVISMDDVAAGGAGTDLTWMPLGMGPSHEDYYPTVVITALMKILKDPSLNLHHTAAVTAVMYIFKTLGLKCVSFLPQIMPPLLGVMRQCPIGMLEFHFQQLGLLVSIVKQHIRNYLTDIFSLVQDFWSLGGNIQITILSLVEAVAQALDGEFKVYLPILLPNMLHIFDTSADISASAMVSSAEPVLRRVTAASAVAATVNGTTAVGPSTALMNNNSPIAKVLHAFVVFGSNLEEYLHLVVPAIVKVFERSDLHIALRKTAIITTGQLCKKINFTDQASRIIHPLVRVLAILDLRIPAMDTLCALVYQMGADFTTFIPLVAKATTKYHIQHSTYEMLALKLLKNEPLPREIGSEQDDKNGANGEENPSETATKKLPVNQQQLKKAWETSQRSTRDDWIEWMRRFSVELLKESPSHALRACASLAGGGYPPLARELFNAGFVSCWGELYDQFQDELVDSLKIALKSPTIPMEIVQVLLNLAEFMEHDDKALPIAIQTLGTYASRCHAYAKALHYRELEFISEALPSTIENLISINYQLQQPDSAIGVLTYAQRNYNVELKESWFEKLQRWEEGLAAYEKRQAEEPLSMEVTFGRMRCLFYLGEWEALSQLTFERWKFAGKDDEVLRKIAPWGAAAAWGVGQWDQMEEYIGAMKQETPDSVFFRAILSLHRNLFPQAAAYIEKTRELLDTELMALVGESYSRAYSVVVRVQMLAELEEIIVYKQSNDRPERQAAIRTTWMNRIKGCQRNIEVWQRILKVRQLVLSPKEDVDMFIKFANLCRKGGRLTLSHRTLCNLLDGDVKELTDIDVAKGPPAVIYASLKHVWSAGQKELSFAQMKRFTTVLNDRLGLTDANFAFAQAQNARGALTVLPNSSQYQGTDGSRMPLLRLLARCHLKLGEWQTALLDDLSEDAIPDILKSYQRATQCDSDWYKAWHAWALANFEALSYYEKQNESSPQVLVSHVVPSVYGFFRSIALSKDGNSLQDTLRLLTLWFKYGYQQDVNAAIGEGFNNVSIDTWLHVIPQLIARIHTASPHVRKLIHQLLSDVGKEHPQALVYSLTVASKSQSVSRRKAAIAIMDKMRAHSAALVEQALLVSQELIRVAILWNEMWHEGLEEASRFYFGDHNVEGMFNTLEPLHQMLERGPETLREISFNQTFGRDLQEAQDWCRKYRRTRNVNDLNQAWDLYYHVFRRINKQLPQLTTLELQYISPKLLNAQNFDLAAPGTYKSGEPIVRIASFAPTLTVLTSKQRPRTLSLKGSDGKQYQYLLKGHEDLRQDERVMQLFGLVNTLLATDPETFKRHLSIQQYPVIPLSPNSGLIGWLWHTDTLHSLIRDYRESRKILFNIEHRLMLQMAPDYDNLTLLEKVEVFEYALENTTGQDLYKVLWLKSKNSEVWLDRRTNYTRSLAVMSMVGYILGLGDRHPSNLMLQRYTGKVIHVDFGDCFEVAMHREKFPEKIPFRLTRMLINAMEVSGIEGNFKITCQNVMRVLRENKESLMAVLEAFVYDPLINWRLLTNASPKGGGDPKQPRTKIDGEMDEEVSARNFPASRKLQKNENDLIGADDDQGNRPEALNTRALSVINRVQNKLTGRDFKPNVTLDVTEQVQRLVTQATSLENLCQCFIGWCAFW